MNKNKDRLFRRGVICGLLGVLAFWLVSTLQAQQQVNLITGQPGYTSIYRGPGFSTTQQFIVSLPSNTGSINFSVENLGSTTGSYSVQFFGVGQNQPVIIGSQSSVFCTHQISGALPPTQISNTFSSANAPSGQADLYTCSVQGTIQLGIALSFTANNIGSFQVGMFSNYSSFSLPTTFNFTHISAATNTQVKATPGFLHTITINGGTAGVVTVVDSSAANCSGGTTLAVIETIGATNPVTLTYDVNTSNGICLTTAAATDVTVSAR